MLLLRCVPPDDPQPQVAADDSAVEASQCAELKSCLKALFLDGGIWLSEAEGTLTHSVLGAVKDTTVFFGKQGQQEVAFLGWPAPGTLARAKPVTRG